MHDHSYVRAKLVLKHQGKNPWASYKKKEKRFSAVMWLSFTFYFLDGIQVDLRTVTSSPSSSILQKDEVVPTQVAQVDC